MRYAYPYELLLQPKGGFTVVIPDVPEAITQGDSEEEAAAMAEDVLVTALSFYNRQVRAAAAPVTRTRPCTRLHTSIGCGQARPA